MTRPDDDDWLDAVARGAFDSPTGPSRTGGDADDAPAIDVARIQALQVGALSDADADAVSAALADDAEARALARALAEPVPPFLASWGQREARRVLAPARRRWIGPAVTVALAAAVALFVFVPRSEPGPDYRIDAVRGVQAPIRGHDAAHETTGGVVDPESVLVVALSPNAADAPDAAPLSRAFAQTPDGRLKAAAVDTIQVGAGGALRFEAAVGPLLGTDEGAFGRRTIWLAVGGASAADLAALDGRTVEAAQDTARGVRWLAVELDYRAGLP